MEDSLMLALDTYLSLNTYLSWNTYHLRPHEGALRWPLAGTFVGSPWTAPANPSPPLNSAAELVVQGFEELQPPDLRHRPIQGKGT